MQAYGLAHGRTQSFDILDPTENFGMNIVVFWKGIKAMNKRQLINARKKYIRIMRICIDLSYMG